MSRLKNNFKQIEAEVFDYGPVVIFKWKNEVGWPVEFVSGNVGINFGYTAFDFTSGRVSYDIFIHPLDLKRVKEEVEEVINSNRFFIEHKPYRIIHGKGDIRWVSDYTTFIKEENDVITFICYVVDITEQVEKEKNLIEIKDRYDHLLDAIREGIWDWDMRTDEVFFSKRWKEMLGFKEDEIQNTLLEWEKRVHKDDIEQCYADIKDHLNGETQIYENVHRMLHKNGKYLWILDRGKKILDTKGEVYRMIGTHKDISEEKEMNELLEQLAQEDSLTGLLNRRAFYSIVHKEMERSKRYNSGLVLLMLDIDHFKVVNDTWGHNFGDVILKEVSKKFFDCVRTTDFIFRLGGEEFGILLPETDKQGAFQLADRIRKSIEEMRTSVNEETIVLITISIGVSLYASELSLDEFMHRSDLALYESKANGRNRVTIFSEE